MKSNPQSYYSQVRGALLLVILGVSGAMALTGFSANSARSIGTAELQTVRFDQKLNEKISLDLRFFDESGREIRLQNYFNDKPVVLVLGYYGCPMLCGLVLNGLVEALQDLKATIGNDFDVVFVSIDPKETPALAQAKKRTYLKRYGRPASEQGWHFLTGSERDVHALAEQVGFRYAYDPVSKQFAHASGFVILSPQGRIAQYFFGVTYSAKGLSAALKMAASERVSSPIQQLLLLCFHYAPVSGKYGPLVVLVLRIMALATVVLLGAAIVLWLRRERAKVVVLNKQTT